MTTLSTENPNQMVYANPILKMTVLGGVKTEGLDRLRITLKIELGAMEKATSGSRALAIRHHLDLYNDNQVEKLVRKVSLKLEIAASVVEACLQELIEQLERYRLQMIDAKKVHVVYEPLSAEETDEAMALLQSNTLMQDTNELIGQSGIIGEENNRLIMFLIFSSRKREEPLHVVSLGSSGTGKTHLQESVGRLIPSTDRIEITTLSENAFYYFGQQELKHKLILIEDLDGIHNALYPLRELQSKKKLSKSIAYKNTQGETKTIHVVVEGPVSVAGCTTKEQIYEDNANRSFLLYLDESAEQDERIMDYQRAKSAGLVNEKRRTDAIRKLQNAQRLLENIKVVNPYAPYLKLPSSVFKPRRTNAHYLHFIELVTYYHQFQRKKKVDKATGEEYIETTLEDIHQVNELLQDVLLRKSDILRGGTRNYFERLKQYLLEHAQEDYTTVEIRSAFKIKESTLRNYHRQLLGERLIEKVKNPEGRSYRFRVRTETEYNALKNKLNHALAECLEQCKTQSRKKSQKGKLRAQDTNSQSIKPTRNTNSPKV